MLKLRVRPARCLRRWYKGSQCDICVNSCPVNAISINGRDVVVNESSCLLCGACASSCPTGVFDIGLEELITESIGGEVIKVTCRESGDGVITTCINALNIHHYMILASRYSKVVVDARCQGCPLSKGPGLNVLEEVVTKLGGRIEVIRGEGGQSPLVRRLTIKRVMVGGASLISPPLGLIASLASGGVVEVLDTRTPERADVTFRLEGLEAASKLGVEIKLRHPVVDDSKCTFCGICAGVCPSGAIEFEEAGILRVKKSMCINCGHCVTLCPENAMTMIESEDSEVIEYTRAMKVCPRCGFVYPASLEDCPKCAVIMDIIRDIYKGESKDCKEYGERIREKLRSLR